MVVITDQQGWVNLCQHARLVIVDPTSCFACLLSGKVLVLASAALSLGALLYFMKARRKVRLDDSYSLLLRCLEPLTYYYECKLRHDANTEPDCDFEREVLPAARP
jgi:hypothetical protein